ncbi:hypothetical protein B5F33_09925 [Collinsella sp. An2]|nr:hypothetical protein B5F33_09925 [Collinsella sp. An2]
MPRGSRHSRSCNKTRKASLPRPTVRGVATVLLGAALMLAGGELASTVLVAWGVALWVAVLAGLVDVLLPLSIPGRAGQLLSLVAPHLYVLDTCWEQLDQHGRVVSVLPARETPRTRGWYRIPAATVRLRDVLGMWRRDRRLEHGAEAVIAPKGTGRSTLASLLRRTGPTARDAQHMLDSSQVRPYEKGDPMRAISWRQTAHHGTLMSFEPVHDEPPSPLVVVDTLTCDEADSLAITAMRTYAELSRRAGADGPILSDGERIYTSPDDVTRLTASLQPDAPKDEASRLKAAKDRAHRVARLTKRRGGRAAIVLVTRQAGGVLEHELRAALPAASIIRVNARTGAADLVRRTVPNDTAQPEPLSQDAPAPDWIDRAAARKDSGVPLALDLVCAVLCVAGLLLGLHLAQALAEPKTWYSVSCATFALVALEGALGRHLPYGHRFAVRAFLKLACAAAVVAISAVCAHHIIQSQMGLNLTGDPSAYLGLGSWARETSEPLGAVVLQGMSDLYFGQWVPLQVSPVADAALTLLVAGAGALVWMFVVSCGVLRPLCGAFPLVILATCQLLMGTSPQAWTLFASLAVFLALGACDAWLYDGEPPATPTVRKALLGTGDLAAALEADEDARSKRHEAAAHPYVNQPGSSDGGARGRAADGKHPLTSAAAPHHARRGTAARLRSASVRIAAPIASIALAACLAAGMGCAFEQQALALVQRLPIVSTMSTTMFASNAVSPVVDLRRELIRGEETQALSYTTDAGHPLYLRLSTLDDFNGDTWLLDSSLPGQNRTGIPLLDSILYADAAGSGGSALPGSFNDGSPLLNAIVATGTNAGPVEAVETQVTIDALATRFAPLPPGAYQTATEAGGSQGDWAWSGDGTVYGTNSSTHTGQSYRVESAYLAPVTTSDDLAALERLPQQLAEAAVSAGAGTAMATSDGANSINARYLNVPGELPQAMTDVLSNAAAQGVPSSPTTAAQELEIMEYLVDFFTQGGFTYSTDAPDGDGHDTLSVMGDFLERREGYCIHYASTLALLARAMGVPSRLAVGYAPNASRDGNGAYIATNHDLHAWTEVYLYGAGWIPIDVTPAADDTTDTPAAETPDTNQDNAQPDSTTPTSPESPASPETPDDPGQDSDTTSPNDEPDASPFAEATASFFAVCRQVVDALAHALPGIVVLLLVTAILVTPSAVRRARRTRRLHALGLSMPGSGRKHAGSATHDAAPAKTPAAVKSPSDGHHSPGAQAASFEEGATRAAALAAWDELVDLACDQGVAISPTATEEDQVRQIGAALTALAEAAESLAAAERNANAGATGSATSMRGDATGKAQDALDLVMRAACTARYGTSASPMPSIDALRSAFLSADEALDAAGRHAPASRRLKRLSHRALRLVRRIFPPSLRFRPPRVVASLGKR